MDVITFTLPRPACPVRDVRSGALPERKESARSLLPACIESTPSSVLQYHFNYQAQPGAVIMSSGIC